MSTPPHDDALLDSNLKGNHVNESDYERQRDLYNQKQAVETERVAQDKAITSALGNPSSYQAQARKMGLNTSLDPSAEEKTFMGNYNPSQTQNEKQKNLTNFETLQKTLESSSQKAINTATSRVQLITDVMNNQHYLDHAQNETRERLVYIQNDAAREKQNLIQRLSVLVYLLIYALGLGIAMAVGLITPRALGYATLIGALVALFFALTTGSVLKTYGELSEKIVKKATKEIVQEIGWDKKCPKKCRPKQLPEPSSSSSSQQQNYSVSYDTLASSGDYVPSDDKRFYQRAFLESRLNLQSN